VKIDTNKTFCFTGHRPDKLYGYDKNSEGNVYLRNAINDSIKYLHVLNGIDTFISGMALGWDMWAAEEVLELQDTYPIKLICAIPCKGHSDKFSKQDKEDYLHIIYRANYVHNVTGIKYFPRCMQIRNEWMINNSIGQIAGWDGTHGGTYNCIQYANKVNKTNRIVINPLTMNVQFLGV
jgi:uncharacterized phage-like protein YoqJ